MLTADRRPTGQRVSKGSQAMSLAGVSRRGEQRAALRQPCRVHLLKDDEQGISLQGQTVNVSPHGVCLLLSMPLQIGTQVELTIINGTDGPQTVSGSVLHQRRVLTGAYETGIQLD